MIIVLASFERHNMLLVTSKVEQNSSIQHTTNTESTMKKSTKVLATKAGPNAKSSFKKRIRARLLTRFERKVIAQRLLLTTAASESSGELLTQNGQCNKSSPFGAINDATPVSCLQMPQKLARYTQPLTFKAEYLRPSQNSRVRFHVSVSVIEIPSHRSYKKEVHRKVWSGLREIEKNAKRNRREFASDGFAWRKCREEDSFLSLRGELVHPETYLWTQRQQQKKLFRRLRGAKKVEGVVLPGVDRVLHNPTRLALQSS